MATVNDDVLDRLIEYRMDLMRYENGVVRDIASTLVDAEDRTVAALSTLYDEWLEAGGPPGDFTARGAATRRRILLRVRDAWADAIPRARTGLRTALQGAARDAQDELSDTILSSMPEPAVDELELSRVPEEQLARIAAARAPVEGAALDVAASGGLSKIGADAVRRVDSIVADGIRDGTGTRQLVGRVRRAVGVRRGSTLFHELAAYVRTSVQTVANDVAGEWYRENDDLVRAEQYVATLDDDTCPICGPLDGRVFRLDARGRSRAPRPPRHPSCRCMLSPVLHNWRQMGLPEDALTPAQRRRLNGRPPERRTWSDWVQGDPERLERALGPSRAALVEQGRVSLRDLATTREVLTLDELARRRGVRSRRGQGVGA